MIPKSGSRFSGKLMLKVNIDAALVRRLIATQFPHWKDLAVRPVASGGWDNRTFHLGDEMSTCRDMARRASLVPR
jgi:aminoglycoside phosphotransferase (APT) family kinase protein